MKLFQGRYTYLCGYHSKGYFSDKNSSDIISSNEGNTKVLII